MMRIIVIISNSLVRVNRVVLQVLEKKQAELRKSVRAEKRRVVSKAACGWASGEIEGCFRTSLQSRKRSLHRLSLLTHKTKGLFGCPVPGKCVPSVSASRIQSIFILIHLLRKLIVEVLEKKFFNATSDPNSAGERPGCRSRGRLGCRLAFGRAGLCTTSQPWVRSVTATTLSGQLLVYFELPGNEGVSTTRNAPMSVVSVRKSAEPAKTPLPPARAWITFSSSSERRPSSNACRSRQGAS